MVLRRWRKTRKMTTRLTSSARYKRFDVFYQRYAALCQIIFGCLLIVVSVFVVVVAIKVYEQQSREHTQHQNEAKTVRIACVRSANFGPPFISFLERVEAKEHTGALTKELVVNGKREQVLAFYRGTIPKSCPSK